MERSRDVRHFCSEGAFSVLSFLAVNRMEATRETVNLKELAYMRRRAVEGRSTRSTSSRVVTSRAHHRQASYQLQNDNKSLDFVYYSDSEDEAVDGKNVCFYY